MSLIFFFLSAFLDIESNGYNSSIPTELAALPSLKFFYVRDSFVSGSFDFMRGSQSFEEVWVDHNIGITGTIPTYVPRVPTLASFSATFCDLTGTIPTEFGLLSNTLQLLYLYHNHLNGTFPYMEWSRLTKLQVLEIQSNDLTGTVAPASSSFCLLTLGALKDLTADCNVCNNSCCTACT